MNLHRSWTIEKIQISIFFFFFFSITQKLSRFLLQSKIFELFSFQSFSRSSFVRLLFIPFKFHFILSQMDRVDSRTIRDKSKQFNKIKRLSIYVAMDFKKITQNEVFNYSTGAKSGARFLNDLGGWRLKRNFLWSVINLPRSTVKAGSVLW